MVIRAYNAFINVPDGSEGLDRRLTVVPFNHRPKEIDTNLSSKLRAELPGIFAWCSSISAAEMKGQLLSSGRIKAVAEASIERFEANNPEFRFIAETFPEGRDGVKASNFYQSYQEWCSANRHRPKSIVKFSVVVQTLGCQRSRGKINGCYYYTIPRMSDSDVAEHLGIVGRQFKDGWRDSSKPDVAPKGDSWGQFEPKNQQNFNQSKLGELEASDQPVNQILEEQQSITLPNPFLANASELLQPSSTVSTLQLGDRVEALIQGTWQIATLIQLPVDHVDPAKKTSFWKIKIDTGEERYIWNIENIRK